MSVIKCELSGQRTCAGDLYSGASRAEIEDRVIHFQGWFHDCEVLLIKSAPEEHAMPVLLRKRGNTPRLGKEQPALRPPGQPSASQAPRRSESQDCEIVRNQSAQAAYTFEPVLAQILGGKFGCGWSRSVMVGFDAVPGKIWAAMASRASRIP